MEIIDVITYNGEKELLELRLNILSPYVDKFIIVEFDKTFSGRIKPFYGNSMDTFLEPWKGKVDWHYHTEKTYGKYREMAESSSNTSGADHWKTEFMMKESIKDCLTNLNDEDIIYLGDCDEIWQPFPVDDKKVFKLKLNVYVYWLNLLSSEQFWGPIAAKYKNIKGKCLNHIRSHENTKTTTEWGWHFTSLKDNLRQKLLDSYTEETYANKIVMDKLEDNIKNGIDFLGRDFTYEINEEGLPEYLKAKKEKYKHLFK